MQWNIRGLVLGSIVLGAVGFSACSDDEDNPPEGTGGTENAGATSKGGATAKGGGTAKGGAGTVGGAPVTGGTTGVGGGPTTGGTTAVNGGAAGSTTVATGGAGVGGTTTAAGGVGVGGTTTATGGVGVGGSTPHAGGNAGVGNVAGTAGAPLGTAGAAGAPPLTNNPPKWAFTDAGSVGSNAWQIRENNNGVSGLLATPEGTTLAHSTVDGGVARWTVPFSGTAAQSAWVFTYQATADLTGKTIKARVRWTSGGQPAGSSGASFNVNVSAMDDGTVGTNYDTKDSPATALTTVGEWVPISFQVPAAAGTWEPTLIGAILVKVTSVAGPTYASGVFDIDFVTWE